MDESRSSYTSEFYRELDSTAQPSAEKIVPLVQELVHARSVLDLGCGDGGWLAVFLRNGAERVLGLDGNWISLECLKIPHNRFRVIDFSEPFELEERFDLSISLEVAEHLPPERASAFVEALTRAAPVVLFSAAIEAQGGTHHVNEQWPEYWIERFAEEGYQVLDVIRWCVWKDPSVTWWYKQNLLLFASPQALSELPALARVRERPMPSPTSVVHPELYLERMEELTRELERARNPSFKKWFRTGRRMLAHWLRG